MNFRGAQTKDKEAEISIPELKKLLFEIKRFRPDIQVRFRLLGQNWHTNFVQIGALSGLSDDYETSALISFNDTSANCSFFIRNIKELIQIELDTPFGVYKPYIHYTV